MSWYERPPAGGQRPEPHGSLRSSAPPPRPAPPQAQPHDLRGAWQEPTRRRQTTLVLEVLGIVVGALGMLWMLGQVVALGGAATTTLAGVLALLPLIGVLAAVAWVDRWEPEPRGLLAAALLWGAGVATVVALVLNESFALVVAAGTGSTELATVLGAVVAAPLTEESAKGLGVLLIYLWRRQYFDGPVDGIVYGATIAAGFAFVENILYFVQYADVVAQIFVVRGIQSPFAHLVFTSCTGIALGAAARSRSRGTWIVLLPLGWGAAVLLHGLWNASATLGVHITVYLLFQVPLFVALVLLVLWLRRRERRTIARRLQEYARAGWFSEPEVAMLTSLPARRSARRWAARRGARRAMRDFQRAATRLALHRERVASGRAHLRHRDDEHALLGAVVDARTAFARAA